MSHLFDSLPRRPFPWSAVLLAVAFALSGGPPAKAVAAGDRFAEDGVTLRLLAERPGADGRFRAALLVDLKSGWKTYWLDPGEGGLPPKIVPAGPGVVSDLALRFPVPHRVADAGGRSNVYSAPFAVAIEGHVRPGAESLDLKADLGICKTICVPVSAQLRAAFPARSTVSAPVDGAFAALPRASTRESGIAKATMTADNATLLVTARAAEAETLDLFVAGPKGWTFGPPARRTDGDARPDTVVFALPVVAKPRKGTESPRAISAILVGGNDAWFADDLPVETGG